MPVHFGSQLSDIIMHLESSYIMLNKHNNIIHIRLTVNERFLYEKSRLTELVQWDHNGC